MTCYDYLSEYEYFTEEELNLVTSGWGNNSDTFDTICQVRYAMDVDQLAEQDDVELEDYYKWCTI